MRKINRYETLGTDIRWMKNLLFTGIFIQENKMQLVFEHYKKLTSKQWLLMVVVDSFDSSPDLTALASVMGCTRQNIKKVASNLEKKGYVALERSTEDARSLCVRMTEQGMKVREEINQMGEAVYGEMFKEFTDEGIVQYYKLSIKMMHGIEYLEAYFKNL